MKKAAMMILVMSLTLGFSMNGYANVCTWAEAKTWNVSAPGKLVRGISNVGFGWTNLFIQPFKGDTAMNGIGMGLSNFFVRTTQGIGEILLFWLPPVPEEPLKDCVYYDWGILERVD